MSTRMVYYQLKIGDEIRISDDAITIGRKFLMWQMRDALYEKNSSILAHCAPGSLTILKPDGKTPYLARQKLDEIVNIDSGDVVLLVVAPAKEQQRNDGKRSIFTHGLPRLGPLSYGTSFSSKSSKPSDERHAPASLRIAAFAELSDLGDLPCPEINIWSFFSETEKNLGGYATESDVNSHVKQVILDILSSLNLREKVRIHSGFEIIRNRPDMILIIVNGHPIGTIEGKRPGKLAMNHPNILGEVYDQLLHLRSIFRVDIPFAILTSYDQWRICWLDEEDSNKRAAITELPQPQIYETPVKEKQSNLENAEDKQKSPSLRTPSQKIITARLQKPDDTDFNVESNIGLNDNNDNRSFCSTKIVDWDDKLLPRLLASLIKKMMLSKQQFHMPPTVLRLANERTFIWKKPPDTLDFDLCISPAVKNFFIWEDLGRGADGKAFLVSGGTKGAVGVLKFFFDKSEDKAQHEEQMWKEVYSHLPPVKKTVRTVKVMGHRALLMPWFQQPKRTQSTLNAVEKTLREDYMGRGFFHGDVAWRNVGVYFDKDHLKAIVFDMQTVRQVENNQNDWVKSAVSDLSMKLE